MQDRLNGFVLECKKAGIVQLNERGTTPEGYRDDVNGFIIETLQPDLARGKSITLLTPCSPKYNPEGERAFTDGLRGTSDYHYNWVGFEGEDMDAVVDLADTMVINYLSVDFIQNYHAWIFLPKEVKYYTSLDGVNFEMVGDVRNPLPDNIPGSFIISFSKNVPLTKARYLKVTAVSLKTCPDWHIGAGEKCWIFTDEIVIQ